MKMIKQIFGILVFAASLTSPAHAHYTLPNFECTLTDDRTVPNDPSRGKEFFYAYATKEIFLVCESNTFDKKDTVRAVWIYETPTAYVKVAEKRVKLMSDLNGVDIFKTRFSLCANRHQFMSGNYHVRLYVNGVEGNRYNFRMW